MVLGLGQQRPRRFAIDGYLRLQGFQAVELPLRAQMLDEGDPDLLAVEIAGEVENVHLQDDVLAVEGGPTAEVGDAMAPVEPTRLGEPDMDRIDAERRPESMWREVQVEGWKAEQTAPLIALVNPALDFPPVPQQLGRAPRPATFQIDPND